MADESEKPHFPAPHGEAAGYRELQSRPPQVVAEVPTGHRVFDTTDSAPLVVRADASDTHEARVLARITALDEQKKRTRTALTVRVLFFVMWLGFAYFALIAKRC